MSEHSGPRLYYSFEALFESAIDLEDPKLSCPLSILDDEDERQWQLKEFCTPLLVGVQQPTDHFQKLDTHFSKLLSKILSQHPTELPKSHTRTDSNSPHISQAKKVLSRLPHVPQRLFPLPFINSGLRKGRDTLWDGIKEGRWASKYVIPEARSQFQLQSSDDPSMILNLVRNMQDLAWDNLFVTVFIDSNSMVLLAKVAILGTTSNLKFAQDFLTYLNLLAELLDVYDSMVEAVSLGFTQPFSDPEPSVQALKLALFPTVDDQHEQGRAILKAFLWTAWQRSVMLYFYYVVGVQLSEGYSSSWNTLLAVRGVKRLDSLVAEDYRGDSVDYLCNWAFELLRTSRSSLGLDFRRMLRRFDEKFLNYEARCVKDSDVSCDGSRPESCHRFTDAETKAQSAHSDTCSGSCSPVTWSELSYRQTTSPRAVAINCSQVHLEYCRVSSQTLAISHVWSHGQGGRPEEGINSCLHERYSRLAKAFGCDSYWIDSACIPSDMELRKEAIKTINQIFSESYVTMVSDQDLQSIDISTLSMDALETLLSALLVCDWNVRAWTMLEAIKSNSIHILCKNDHSISLLDLLSTVHRDGAIDLAVLLGSAQHLIPSSGNVCTKTVEEGGYLLSQRHASRPDDEIFIWGLLNNRTGVKEGLSMWRGQTIVQTGFLMSSVPRVECPCYSWAPESPYTRPQLRSFKLTDHISQEYTVRYPAYDGQASFTARITPQGLLGKWFVCDMDSEIIEEHRRNFCEWSLLPVKELEHRDMDPILNPDIDTANACNLIGELMASHGRVRVLRPLAADGVNPYNGGSNRGEQFGAVATICASADNGATWKWIGVYQWNEDNLYVGWRVEEMLLV